MLFMTNRNFKEPGDGGIPDEPRQVTFDLNNNEPRQQVYFCEKTDDGTLFEIGSTAFFSAVKKGDEAHVLLYVHGFNNQPFDDIFPRATELQRLCDAAQPGAVRVVPLIWPCDNDFGIIKDYWDDQDAADASTMAFVRALAKFMKWRENNGSGDDACLKRIDLLAHSMGNRVARMVIERWNKYYPEVPLLFRNVFMCAPDVVNETLERGEPGYAISLMARNVVVYYANDDLSMPASKVANLKNKVVSRRLGLSGPEDMGLVRPNVHAIDCDDINNVYDTPKGHAYFLGDGGDGGNAGVVFKHLFHALTTGRVDSDPVTRTKILHPDYSPPGRA